MGKTRYPEVATHVFGRDRLWGGRRTIKVSDWARGQHLAAERIGNAKARLWSALAGFGVGGGGETHGLPFQGCGDGHSLVTVRTMQVLLYYCRLCGFYRASSVSG